MSKYINELVKILSVTLGLALIPHFVLAKSSKYDAFIDKKIQEMSLEEKVGQLFIVGFPQTKLTPELSKFISTYKPGSFLLFKRNIRSLDQVSTLNKELYSLSFRTSNLPPLIAVDQEGGSVSRLPITPPPPNALALGKTQSRQLAKSLGREMGLFLREVGINMNLAPVLDVADPMSSSFIGVRSLSSNPNIVAQLGTAYSEGLMQSKVIPTAKHFPGTGNIVSDPHHTIGSNNASRESLFKNDLKPFKEYALLGTNIAMMLSHYTYPALDPARVPASFSEPIVKGILRDEMKYSGLVVTDDLQMDAARDLLKPEEAALKALLAGSDMVMLTYSFEDQAKAFKHIQAAVRSGSLSVQEIDQKIGRILRAKAFANLYRRNPQQPSLSEGSFLTSAKYKDIESSILSENLKINLLSHELPEKGSIFETRRPASLSRICLLSPSKSFTKSFSERSLHSIISVSIKSSSQAEATHRALSVAKCSTIVAAVTGPRSSSIVRKMPDALKRMTVVVNLGAPKIFKGQKEYLKVLQLYFGHQNAGEKVALSLEEILMSAAPITSTTSVE